MNENTNEVMETLEETKETLVETAQETDSHLGKTVLTVVAVLAGAGLAIYGGVRYFKGKKSKEVVDTEAKVSDVDHDDSEDSEETTEE